MVVLGGGAVSYERGTPVVPTLFLVSSLSHGSLENPLTNTCSSSHPLFLTRATRRGDTGRETREQGLTSLGGRSQPHTHPPSRYPCNAVLSEESRNCSNGNARCERRSLRTGMISTNERTISTNEKRPITPRIEARNLSGRPSRRGPGRWACSACVPPPPSAPVGCGRQIRLQGLGCRNFGSRLKVQGVELRD